MCIRDSNTNGDGCSSTCQTEAGYSCTCTNQGSTCTSLCGDGLVTGSEQCDQGGANGTATSCCTTTCTFRPTSFTCRADAGQCDVAETCTGTSGVCPGNSFEPAATLCMGASQGGVCDNDAADHCTGTSNTCVDVFRPASVTCRADAGQCDVAETCTGTSGTCPANSFEPVATLCTGASQGGACDNDPADHCTCLLYTSDAA